MLNLDQVCFFEKEVVASDEVYRKSLEITRMKVSLSIAECGGFGSKKSCLESFLKNLPMENGKERKKRIHDFHPITAKSMNRKKSARLTIDNSGRCGFDGN